MVYLGRSLWQSWWRIKWHRDVKRGVHTGSSCLPAAAIAVRVSCGGILAPHGRVQKVFKITIAVAAGRGLQLQDGTIGAVSLWLWLLKGIPNIKMF